jgi:predicted enzyme related to lactoylglutathione lyase
MANPVVHFEIGGHEITRSRDFYSELFGWNIEVDEHGYGMVDTGTDEGIRGGIMQTPQGVPPYVTLYVGVDDLEKYLERAETLGGKRVMGPMPVGEMGAFAMFADPDGVVIGLFKENA